MTGELDNSVPAVVLKLDGQGAVGLVRSLGRLGVPVYGLERSARAPATRSRYLREWSMWDLDVEPPEDSVRKLLELAARIGDRPILIPTDDAGTLFVNDHADVLGEIYRLPRQPAGLARELYSKKGMYDVCKRLGIPTPDTDFPESRAGVVSWLEREPSFPVVFKPIAANRGLRMVFARDADELLAAYDRLETPGEPGYMLQEYIPGDSASVWMFDGYCDEHGECLIGFTGQKLRQRPPDGGVTSLGICVHNEAVADASRDLLRRVGYRGIVDMGWRFDERDGRYKLLDVNPRLGWTFRLFVGTDGMDVARALYLDLTGQPVPASEPHDGRKWLVEDLDLVSSIRYWRDGSLSLTRWLRSFRGVEETAWFARDDPRPFLALARRRAASLLPLARRRT
jgi:D-aspartate ligase